MDPIGSGEMRYCVSTLVVFLVDRTCQICRKVFKFLSKLAKHRESAKHQLFAENMADLDLHVQSDNVMCDSRRSSKPPVWVCFLVIGQALFCW